jgi:hypothetical protein
MTPPPLLLPPLLDPPAELEELEELDELEELELDELEVDPPELAACGGDTSGAIDADASDFTCGEVFATTVMEWVFAPCLTWTVFSFEPPRRPTRNAPSTAATPTAATMAIWRRPARRPSMSSSSAGTDGAVCSVLIPSLSCSR